MIDPAVLQGAYILHGLTDSQIAEVAKHGEVKHFHSGQLMAKIGDMADELFIVLDGNLAVMTSDGDRLGEIGRGSVVGEIALVDARPRTANVVCVGPASAVVFPVDSIRKVMSANREWGFIMLSNVAKVLAGRLRQADARIDELTDKASDVWHNAMG